MKNSLKQKFRGIGFGFLAGIINATLGAGGGMVAVPLLKKSGFDQKGAQSNAIAVILPITVISCGIYYFRGSLNIPAALTYIPTGLLGAFIGTKFLKKISNLWLSRIFGGFMIFAGLRLLFR